MDLPFTHRPGRRERHLLRQHQNPLFGWPPPEIAPEVLLAAQKADHADLETFREAFRALVQRAVDLPADADSERVLGLKQDLERAYEQSFGLPEDHERERSSLAKLIEVIMRAVRRAAGPDPIAAKELHDEGEARALHFRLLEFPLVADLLNPESPIQSHELAATLLVSSDAELDAALDLFDAEQVAAIAAEASALMQGLAGRGLDLSVAERRLGLILGRVGSGASRH